METAPPPGPLALRLSARAPGYAPHHLDRDSDGSGCE
ncbi:excalibur calcium-binding domain-containing protein [Arthrobacter pascens]|nr:excalibur calcium-binding domain-containing protein [Arthrobacter pascens]